MPLVSRPALHLTSDRSQGEAAASFRIIRIAAGIFCAGSLRSRAFGASPGAKHVRAAFPASHQKAFCLLSVLLKGLHGS